MSPRWRAKSDLFDSQVNRGAAALGTDIKVYLHARLRGAPGAGAVRQQEPHQIPGARSGEAAAEIGDSHRRPVSAMRIAAS